MEQKQLSQGAIIQIAGSALIALSVFLTWIAGIMGYNLSLIDFFTIPSHDTPILAFIPWVIVILAVLNAIFVFLKNKKVLSVILLLCTLAVGVFVFLGKTFTHEFKNSSLGIGFYLAIIGIVALVYGMIQAKKGL